MTLSKRDSGLLFFDQVYRASARGDGAVLLVSGPVGSGKTALLQAMAARAGAQGGRAFVVAGSAGERGYPYGALERLIQSLCSAGMLEPFPGGIDSDEDFFVMMDRLGAAFRSFADGRPVVFGIDDLHFADKQSLRCLSYLVRRIESCGVVVVVNECTSYERDMADVRAEILHLPFCHRVRLAPLTLAEIADQLRERLGGVPDWSLVQFCAQLSGGSPLLLHAVIDDLAAVDGSAAALVPAGTGEPGANFRQAVLLSLHRCAPPTARVAQAIAVLGDHAGPELIAALCGVDVALVGESIRDLREMGLLRREWFEHPHTRAAVLAGIPVPSLPEMHRRAAELLHESGAPASAVAEHLITAQDGGKAPWRVAILGEAAREAMMAGDIDSAVLSLRHAVGASSDEAQRARAGALLAEALWHIDPSRAARRLGEIGDDARAGLLAVPDLMIAVNQLLWWGEFAEADELLRIAGDDGGDDSGLAHLWAVFCRAGGGDGLCDDDVQQAGSLLAHSGPMAAATYLSSAASLSFADVQTDRADQMLLGLRAGAPLTPALYALVVLVRTGRLDEAVAWCDRLLKEDWINRVPMRRAMIATIESVAILRAGDSASALRCIQEVFDAVPPSAWGVLVGLPMSVAVRASTDLGDTDAARSYLAVPVPPAMFDTPFALPYHMALGWYHLAMNHPESAAMHTRSCLELITRWGVDPSAIAVEPGDRGGGKRSATKPPEPAAAGADDGAKLTDAEQRVAALAAAGNTNRQIAERLFITVSTVEQHLTKIYRKLNVRSRSGLRRLNY